MKASRWCQIHQLMSSRKACFRPAEFVVLETDFRVCSVCRSRYYSLDEVEVIEGQPEYPHASDCAIWTDRCCDCVIGQALERNPRIMPVFEAEPLHAVLAAQLSQADYRSVLGELLGEIIDYLAKKNTDARDDLYRAIERARQVAGIKEEMD